MREHRKPIDGANAVMAAFDHSAFAMLVADADGAIVYANAACAALMQRDVTGTALADLLPDFEPTADGPSEHALETDALEPLWAQVSAMPLQWGDSLCHAITLRDIGAERQLRRDCEILTLVANETDRAVVVTDGQGIIIYVNQTFTTMFGYTAEEAIGQRGAGYLSEGGVDTELTARLYAKVHKGEGFQEEMLARSKTGQPLWMSGSISPSFDASGALKNLTLALTNITESKQLQVLQRDVLEAVAQDRPLAEVMTLICQKVQVMAPDVICTVLSVDSEGKVHPLAAPALPAYFNEALEGAAIGPMAGSCGTAAWRGEPVVVEDIDTDPLWADYKGLALPLGLLACWSTPIKLRDGRVAGTFGFYFRQKRGPSSWHEHIVSACVHLCVVAMERHEAKAHIAKLAYYDTLTGLPNRILLREQIQRSISSGGGDKRLAFMFLDLDRFKDVNDTLGHSVGDALLVEIARRLQRQVRTNDAVSRHGGDEFVAMFTDCDAQKAAGIADRLLEALAEPIVIDGHVLPVSTSIGISLYPDDGLDEEALLKHADAAMYEAKNAGRGTYRFFSPHSNTLAQERIVLGAALRDSIARGLMRLHYQPQVRTQDGQVHGVEALARWNHPLAGEVAPSRFIALAEECGLIEAIGDWAMNEALRQLAEWRGRGIAIPSVSVNLSPIHFRNPTLFGTVVRLLKRHGIAPAMLTIEITEGIMMDESPAVMKNAQALHDHGVNLSMDDFGTGYSSLSHLARLPVGELKIDRGFMRDIDTDKTVQALVTAVVRIGQALGLTVVAEGVETETQRRFLASLQCQVVQGYLFSKALTPEDLEYWFAGYEGKARGAA